MLPPSSVPLSSPPPGVAPGLLELEQPELGPMMKQPSAAKKAREAVRCRRMKDRSVPCRRTSVHESCIVRRGKERFCTLCKEFYAEAVSAQRAVQCYFS